MAVRSIRVKVISVIIAVLALSVAVSIFITVTNQRDNLLDETRKNLAVTGDILNNVIRNIMLSGEAPIATMTLADIQGIQEFTDIAIYRTDGTNAFHDESTIDMVNSYIGEERFETSERAGLRMLESPYFKEVLETNTPVDVETPEERKFEYFFPILNYAECRECHGDTGFIRGIAHYEVSTAQIYDRIGSARNTLTIFFIGSGIVITFVLFLLLRQIIISPLLSIGGAVERVGTGDLDVQLKSRSEDEIGSLAGEINNMIGGLKDKSRLEIENSIIETRNQENRKYLENINEGLLLLNRDQRISEQYSSFLEKLFGTDKIESRRFSEFIYPDHPEDSEERRELDQFIDLIFQGVNTDMEMIMSINPLSDKILTVAAQGGGVREITIETTFLRIIGEEDIDNIMVIFEDKTELARVEQELETERLRSVTEIEQIQAILRTGPQSFVEFVQDADSTLQLIDDNVEDLGDTETLHRLFRALHSLKGAARYMELRSFSGTLHATEEIIASVRDGSRAADTSVRDEALTLLETLYGQLRGIKSITDKFKEFASQDALSQQFSRSIRGLFENLQRMTSDIAAELGKKVRLRTSTEIESVPFLRQLRDPIIHLLRNSLDHGIEDSFERISAGKNEEGIIDIRFLSSEAGMCTVEVQDDGAGIDFEVIGRRAVELGLLKPGGKPTNAQLLRILFLPAFSSRVESSELSGRGVGLDAVHAGVNALGGAISVATKIAEGTKFTLKIPIADDEGDQE